MRAIASFSNDRTIIDTSQSLQRSILSCSNDIPPLLIEPFYLFVHVTDKPKIVKHLAGRAYVINDTFVYKDDEQPNANELSFVAYLFAKLCKIRTPNMVLATLDYSIQNDLAFEGQTAVQIMDYLKNWENYKHFHQRGDKFVKQLAQLLAFDLIIGNGDRFIFIFRLIDDIVFADDPDYTPHGNDLWDDPQINEGNFGFVGDDLWSLDARSDYNPDQLDQIHRELTNEFLTKCSRLMGQYFNLSKEQISSFYTALLKYVNKYALKYPLFLHLHSLALNTRVG